MLSIIYQDEHYVAIHKPAGLLVHRSEIDRHETRFAVQLLRDQLGRMVWPVHRLDRGTSGVLLFGLSSDATRLAGKAFETDEVAKTYYAVVRGWPAEYGRIEHPLTRQPDPYERRQAAVDAPAQAALTDYQRLACTELPFAIPPYSQSRYALLRVEPKTGRRHQIRRHLKHIAHPIIGDATHGKGIHNRMFQTELNCHRMLLICQSMQLKHPFNGKTLTLASQLDADFAALMIKLGWADHVAEFMPPQAPPGVAG